MEFLLRKALPIAIQLIRDRHAIDDVRVGRILDAARKVKNIWASLPGAGYGQQEHILANLLKTYTIEGGSCA